jgi:hypothetical protein
MLEEKCLRCVKICKIPIFFLAKPNFYAAERLKFFVTFETGFLGHLNINKLAIYILLDSGVQRFYPGVR